MSYTQLGSLAGPIGESEYGHQESGYGLSPVAFRESQVSWFDDNERLHGLTENELRLHFMTPQTFEQTHALLKRQMGDQLDQQYSQTLGELQAQYEFLERRQRDLQRLMNQPVNLFEQLMPMMLMGSYTGDTDLAAMGALMQMMMLPQLEQQKRDRYWNAITDVLAEKNKVIAAIRTWESLSLRERQALLSNARMLSNQVTNTALRAIDLYGRRHLQRLRLMLDREQTVWGRRRVAQRMYMNLYDDLLKTLDNYPNIEARRQIYQSFLPSLNQVAQEAGLANPPHASLAGVLTYPSLRTSQNLVQLINGLQRLELNQVFYHSAQLGLIDKQISIQRGLERLRQMRLLGAGGARGTQSTQNLGALSLSGLLTIYNFTYYVEDTASDNPSALQSISSVLGDDWRQGLVDLRARIAAELLRRGLHAGVGQQSGQGQQNQIDPNQLQQLMNDPVSLRQYIEYLAGTQEILDVPLDPASAQFVQDIFGNVRFMARDSEGKLMPTFSLSHMVQSLHASALQLFGQYGNWQGGGGDIAGVDPNAGTPAMDDPTGGMSGNAGSPSSAPATIPGVQGQPSGGAGVAVRPISALLFGNATRPNILDMQNFAEAINQGAAINSASPQVQQVFRQIAQRHLVQFQLPGQPPLPNYRPLVGLSQPLGSTSTDLQSYNSYLAYRPIEINGQQRIVLSVPIAPYRLTVGNQTHRFDVSAAIRRITGNPQTRTLTDVILLESDTGDYIPYLVVSVPYAYRDTTSGTPTPHGVRVPVLIMPVSSLATAFSQHIMDNSLQNYTPQGAGQSVQWRPPLGTNVSAVINEQTDSFMQALNREIETILNSGVSGQNRDVALNTALARLWREYQSNLESSLGFNLFDSILWMPVGF